jgi:Fic family protein
MNRKMFGESSPGTFVKTIQGALAFVPAKLPPEVDFNALFNTYGDAMSGIGTLNAKLAQLGNPNLAIRPLQRREALQSSAMEGTYTTSDELALLEAGVSENVRADTREVLNYVIALDHAVALMKSLPICHRLIQETHENLLSGLPVGRGGNKRPGQYKRDQNWIGGATIETARFVPPPPAETQIAMDQLETFINRPNTADMPALLEAALVHYQFETIHPFADGNGRVGRILIPLLLLSRKLIGSAVFYPSASMEERKDEYIDRMFDVSSRSDWTGWIRFFLEICRDTCLSTVAVIDRMITLQNDYRQKAMQTFRSNNVLILIDHLFINPVVSAPMAQELLGVTHRAARMTIGNLEQIGIVEKIPGLSMPEFFAARSILRASS